MSEYAAAEEFLTQRHIAVVGVSRNPNEFANELYRNLRDGGRTLYPVNINGGVRIIEGDTAYRTVFQVPDPVDGVIIMLPPSQTVYVVQQAIARGIERVWMFRGVGRGSVSHTATSLCVDAGISVIEGGCPMMFLEPVRGVHRLHRALSMHLVTSP